LRIDRDLNTWQFAGEKWKTITELTIVSIEMLNNERSCPEANVLAWFLCRRREAVPGVKPGRLHHLSPQLIYVGAFAVVESRQGSTRSVSPVARSPFVSHKTKDGSQRTHGSC
jgi:hypothetical protein